MTLVLPPYSPPPSIPRHTIATHRHILESPNQAPGPEAGSSEEERAMVRAIQVRQAMQGIQNGVLRVIFVALAILKVRPSWWSPLLPY